MARRPEGLQGEFRLLSDEFEDGDFKLFLPFSNLNRWVEEEDFLSKASKRLGAWKRLGGIRVLSFLSYVGPAPEKQYFIGYTHDRLDHSLVVALTAGEIGRRNNLPVSSINYLEAAGLLHDIATPALGDTAKSIDPENLDEEKFWRESLDNEGREFLKNENLNPQKIDGIINNGGVLGQILDVADRITYTMKDLRNVIRLMGNKINVRPYLIEIRYPLSHHPDIGNIFKDVAIDQKKGLVFFSDQDRLGVFLLFRALMHKHLYMDPTSQGRDLFVANLLKPLYSTDGSKPFSPERLREMTDREALDVLAGSYNFPRLRGDWIYTQLTNWYPMHQRCETVEDAKETARKISHRYLVLGIKECKGFDTGISYLTLDEDGNVIPFREADVSMARQIEEVERATRGVFIYYTDVSKESPINKLLEATYNSS